MRVYLACLEHDCGCRDATVVGVFTDKWSAEEYASEQLTLPENRYFTHSCVEEFDLDVKK